MKITVIIPTFNEAENIELLLDNLAEVFKKDFENSYNILVVDANSIDNTQNIVKEKIKTNTGIYLLAESKKEGLGRAYIKGFKYVLNNIPSDVVVEMDADFQHNPNDISRMIKGIHNGADCVVGSRFIKGGSLPKDWQIYRKILSWGGNIFTKIVLNIYTLNDFTSGFRATKVRGFIDKLDFESLMSGGFAYKMDLLHKLHFMGANIKEIPIVFGVRDRGDSKMEAGNFIDSLKVVLLIRYHKSKSFVRFVLVGFTGLFIDASIFNLIRLLNHNSSYSAGISGLFGMLTTYILNNFWSFSHNKITHRSKLVYTFVIYILISLIPIAIRIQIVHFSNLRYGDTFVISNTAFFIGIVFGLVWNYLFYSKMLWKGKK